MLTDFGLARALDDATLTGSGMIAGTPPYMSPEQARGDVIDARSDLFSLGSLLYALSTGRPPFRAETPLGVLRKVTETSPRPITQINERMPPWLDQLIGQLMQVDVDRRTPSAEAAVELLTASHAHVTNPSVHALPNTLRGRSQRRRRGVMIAVTMIAITLFGALAFRNQLESANQRESDVAVAVQTTPSTPQKLNPKSSVVGDWNGREIDTQLQDIQESIDVLSADLNSNLPQ